jgi:3-methyl-2-oxobutanoate hydroxymethyltransferase
MTRPPQDREQKRPSDPSDASGSVERSPMTIPRVAEMKASGEPLVMVTAYDFPSAQVAEEAGVDIVLVGDTAAMVVLGYDATTPVGMEEMLMMAGAVRRGLKTPLLIGDMPFGSYETSNEDAVRNAQRFVKEAGCDAVKLERGGASVDRARAIIRAGIPVMGHVGLTPQTATQLGGFKAQGRTAEAAAKLAEETLALQSIGCFAVVFEAIPAGVTEALMERLEVPVIGIGAGPATDGQVLVFHDLLGIYAGHTPRFVRRYAEVREAMVNGVRGYAEDVRSGAFPDEEHSYSIPPEELEEFKRYLSEESLVGTDTPWDW